MRPICWNPSRNTVVKECRLFHRFLLICQHNRRKVSCFCLHCIQNNILDCWYNNFITTSPVGWTGLRSWKQNRNLIWGNKMPTRCNRGFYCRSYCLLNMFRAPLCPSSGAQEYYAVVAACGISCCGFSSCWSGVELRVMCPVCRMLLRSAIKISVSSNWQFISTY